MGKVVLDRRGTLRSKIFWQFSVPFDDGTDSLPPDADWIIVPRVPTNDHLQFNGEATYLWVGDLNPEEDDLVSTSCTLNKLHVVHQYYRKVRGEVAGGSRLAAFIPTSGSEVFAVSPDFRQNIQATKVRGAQFDRLEITVNQSDLKNPLIWALQFMGEVSLRKPLLVDVANRCPFCNKGAVLCDACGCAMHYCQFCKQRMTVNSSKHEGKGDKRLPFPDDYCTILEGHSWDGCDLIQGQGHTFASNRFIDWLLKVHAAPFYAEPVLFCVDGMNEQQKKWFDEIQKPFVV